MASSGRSLFSGSGGSGGSGLGFGGRRGGLGGGFLGGPGGYRPGEPPGRGKGWLIAVICVAGLLGGALVVAPIFWQCCGC